MKVDDIRNYMRRRPFAPFEITTRDGERVAVRHPENIAVGSDRLAVILEPGFAILWIEEVVSIRSLKNGGRRRKRA